MINSMKQTVNKNPTCWKRRTTLERGLTVISVTDVLLCIALVIGIGVTVSNSAPYNIKSYAKTRGGRVGIKGVQTVAKQPREQGVCLSRGCLYAASTVKKNMDSNVHPCDDFYKFACGGFLKSTHIPDEKTRATAFDVINDKLQEQLWGIIKSNGPSNERKPFRLVKNLYKSCMNNNAIENKGLEPLREMLKKLGGWPVLDGDNWNEDGFDWRTSMYKFSGVGYSVNYFMSFRIGVDMKDHTKRVIILDQASLGLRRQYLAKGLGNKLVQAYYRYMVDIAVMLRAEEDRAKRELEQSLLFEMKLAKIFQPKIERRNATQMYNRMTLTQLTKKYPSVPWRDYFTKLLPSNIIVGKNEIVIVNVPKYISDLEKLMANTPKRVQANYAMWRVSRDSVSGLNEEIRKREFEYSRALNGITKRAPRWEQCLSSVSSTLPVSVGAMYVRKHFNEEAKQNAVEMVMDIRQQFIKILQQVEWMDEKTRKSALEKAKAMSSYIAYPDELLDDEKLEEFYKKLELSEDDYFGNKLNVSLFDSEYLLSKLRKPVNKRDWIRHGNPAVVNAAYSFSENSIVLHAGILQGAFFRNDRPRYMNYGGIGLVIGHEITHGFDDKGRQFDKDGNVVDWWAPSTNKKYLERVTCIINQYANYTATEVNLNLRGINTQRENFADNGGIKVAYLAYNNWVKRNGPEQTLPDLPYTPRQMFWISAANTGCSRHSPEALRHDITTDVHSPDEFRIIGTLSNMVEFSRDFKCRKGSKMNPKKKCSVW